MANKDYLEKMYDSQLQSQKTQLEQDYNQGLASLDERQRQARQQTQQNLNRTAVEAEKAQRNYAEVSNASGLTSGAAAQARLAQGNQLQADLTALRGAQQEQDAAIAGARTELENNYLAALRQAQAANDANRANALYQEEKEAEAQRRQERQAAAQTMAGAGDFSLYAQLYGLTPEQTSALQSAYGRQDRETAAEAMASLGDFSLYGQLYGLTDAQVAALEKAWQGRNGGASAVYSGGKDEKAALEQALEDRRLALEEQRERYERQMAYLTGLAQIKHKSNAPVGGSPQMMQRQ